MKLFRTKSYSNKIEEIEVERQTDKTVWYYIELYNGNKKLSQDRKESSHHNFHNTYEEAKQFLLDKVEKKLNWAKKNIEHLEKEIEEINNL